jgi:diguanylate cyclase
MQRFEIMMTEGFNDKRSLVRDILNSLWAIIGLYIFATGLNLIFTSYDKWIFFKEVTLYPSLILICILCVVEVYFKKRKKRIEYVLAAALILMAVVIIVTLYAKIASIFLLVFPVLISLFFYNIKLIRFSSISSIVSLLAIYSLSKRVRSYMELSDFILMVSIIVGVSILINSLMKHSTRLINELTVTTKEKQDLFSKNIFMERLTRIDPVTELYNHRSFYEHLDSIFSFCSPNELTVHVTVIDIDNFKQVNDIYGHRAGDRVIIEVAKKIQSLIEKDDFPSRYGGEEFAIISIGTSTEDLLKRLEAIRLSIANTNFSELNGNTVSVSIGLQKLLPGMNKEQLFQGADSALYSAKKTGKNKTVLNIEE